MFPPSIYPPCWLIQMQHVSHTQQKHKKEMCSSKSTRNKTKLQVLLLQNSCKCVLAACALPSVSWFQMHKAVLLWTGESALFNWDPLHRAFFCTRWVRSCLQGAWKMGQRNHQKRMTRRLSHITPLESKEAFYTGKMGSWLTKKPPKFKICYY